MKNSKARTLQSPLSSRLGSNLHFCLFRVQGTLGFGGRTVNERVNDDLSWWGDEGNGVTYAVVGTPLQAPLQGALALVFDEKGDVGPCEPAAAVERHVLGSVGSCAWTVIYKLRRHPEAGRG